MGSKKRSTLTVPTNAEHILGIDPGGKTGLAIVDISSSPALVGACAVPMVNSKGAHLPVAPAFDELVGNMDKSTIHVVIEDQYVGANQATAVTLSQRAGRWLEVCIERGITVEMLAAQVWQSKELPGARKRDERKRMARARVFGLWKQKLSSDAADAALIARYCSIVTARQRVLNRAR
jgi:Holliday junction resolvasome RuvABC endonuclease subunit